MDGRTTELERGELARNDFCVVVVVVVVGGDSLRGARDAGSEISSQLDGQVRPLPQPPFNQCVRVCSSN